MSFRFCILIICLLCTQSPSRSQDTLVVTGIKGRCVAGITTNNWQPNFLFRLYHPNDSNWYSGGGLSLLYYADPKDKTSSITWAREQIWSYQLYGQFGIVLRKEKQFYFPIAFRLNWRDQFWRNAEFSYNDHLIAESTGRVWSLTGGVEPAIGFRFLEGKLSRWSIETSVYLGYGYGREMFRKSYPRKEEPFSDYRGGTLRYSWQISLGWYLFDYEVIAR